MTRKRGAVWYIEFSEWVGGKAVRRRVATNATTKREAEALERELRVRATRSKLGLDAGTVNPSRMTLGQAVAWWCKHVGEGQKQGERAAFTLKKHITRERPDFAALRLEDVTTDAIEVFLEERARTCSLSPSTVNNIRALLSGVFTRLKLRKLFLGAHPVRDTVKRQAQDKTGQSLPAWMIGPMLDKAPSAEWRRVLSLAAYAGMRRGEVWTLEWRHVDLDEGMITIAVSKTGVSRTVAIHPHLALQLELVPESARVGLVVRDASQQNAADAVASSLKRAGITAPKGVRLFHALRHAWASRLAELDANMELVELMGWGKRRSSVMRSTYVHTQPAKLRAEINRLWWPTRGESVVRLKENA